MTAVRRWLAECAGTLLLVGLGTGTLVEAGRHGGIPSWAMAAAWFAAVLLPIALFVERSGAHLNPAVTLALVVSGRFSWKAAPAYWSAQLLGALGASTILFELVGDEGHLGATVPVGVGWPVAFAVEAVFTTGLVAAVFLLADSGEGRHRWRITLPPLAVGVATYCIGPITGSSLNPARTIAPALVSGTFTDLWVYLLAVPTAAAALALVWPAQAVDVADRGMGRRRSVP